MNLKLLAIIFLMTSSLMVSGCLEYRPEFIGFLDSGQSENTNITNNSNLSPTTDLNTSDIDYRQQMRNFVIGISNYSKQEDSDFIVIPQNGQELLTFGGDLDILLAQDYIAAIDGVGREGLFFGYDEDNVATDEEDTEYMTSLLDIAKNNGVSVLVTDYCWNLSYAQTSYSENSGKGYLSFAADSRDLDSIPEYPLTPYNVNNYNIRSLADAKNFLYLIDPEEFESREEFLDVLKDTNYDVLIIDLFYDDEALSAEDVESLKTKANGGSRLVIAYMSIGEAEDYRYYWNNSWSVGSPVWLEAENPEWSGNYKVRYWDVQWQAIIYGNDEAYLDRITNAGFDGAYLDIIDAYEYFE